MFEESAALTVGLEVSATLTDDGAGSAGTSTDEGATSPVDSADHSAGSAGISTDDGDGFAPTPPAGPSRRVASCP